MRFFFSFKQATASRWWWKKCSWFYNKSQNAFIFHEKIYIIISWRGNPTSSFSWSYQKKGFQLVFLAMEKIELHYEQGRNIIYENPFIVFIFFKNFSSVLVFCIISRTLFICWLDTFADQESLLEFDSTTINLSPSLRVVFCCEVTQFS